MLSGTPPTVIDLHVASSEWTSSFDDYLQSHSLGDLGYRIPTGTSAQSKSLPWFNIDVIVISFSEDVNVQAADLSLSGISAASIAFSDFSYDALAHVATWTLASPLPKNVYQLDLDGNGVDPVTDVDGNILDGEWTNNSDTFASGNGTAGGDFAFMFKVLPGDIIQNNGVEYYDYYAAASRQGLTTASSNYLALADIDGSGVIEAQDAQDVYSKLWSTYSSGSPVGTTNDSPSTDGGESVYIDNASTDYALSLWSAFQDAETGDNQLTYQILSNSNPSLFDSVSINSSSGNLVMNAASGQSGRSAITVRATDSVGLTSIATFFADVFYVNQPPVLDYIATSQGSDTWLISGSVSDPDDVVEGMLVNFSGVFDLRASVREDGTFEFAVIVDSEDWGWEWAQVVDPHGLASDSVLRVIGVT